MIRRKEDDKISRGGKKERRKRGVIGRLLELRRGAERKSRKGKK